MEGCLVVGAFRSSIWAGESLDPGFGVLRYIKSARTILSLSRLVPLTNDLAASSLRGGGKSTWSFIITTQSTICRLSLMLQ